MNGFLVPDPSGDPIPLVKETIVLGRHHRCDIQLDHPSVSSRHCELIFDRGSWVLKDLGCQNGTKVNGVKVQRQRVMPGDQILVARHKAFRLQYEIEAPVPSDDEEVVEIRESLLRKAGLERVDLDKMEGSGEVPPKTPPKRPK